ncbi:MULTISPECIES: hypothetical protein [unclassified Wolbachia]|nr:MULTISPECIES: hypothetical protein [unclassified Wolbachia]ONI56705.1 hypothetical protein N500_0205 [Wolbachia pipientis wUni]RLT60656.1 hypothetical protein WANA31_0939 [Wolbachia endosymbiont of Drosophila ananassae]
MSIGSDSLSLLFAEFIHHNSYNVLSKFSVILVGSSRIFKISVAQ